MLGRIEGRRRGGWQRMRWLDGITNSMDMSLSKLWEFGDGQGGLVCCGPWGRKESDTTEWLNNNCLLVKLNWLFGYWRRSPLENGQMGLSYVVKTGFCLCSERKWLSKRNLLFSPCAFELYTFWQFLRLKRKEGLQGNWGLCVDVCHRGMSSPTESIRLMQQCANELCDSLKRN